MFDVYFNGCIRVDAETRDEAIKFFQNDGKSDELILSNVCLDEVVEVKNTILKPYVIRYEDTVVVYATDEAKANLEFMDKSRRGCIRPNIIKSTEEQRGI